MIESSEQAARSVREGVVSVTIIEPPKRWAPLRLGDLWAYRELFLTLAWRDLKVRYKQTELGAAWAVIQPFFLMIVFTFIGQIGRLPTDGVPGPVFYFTALVPWTYFASSMQQSGNSLVDSAALITKVYFPRLVIPLASVMAGLVDFAIAFVFLVAMTVFYGIHPGIGMIVLPYLVVLAMLAALSVGLWLSALNVEYRDIRYVIPFLAQFWMLVSVPYSFNSIPARWRIVYALNPMADVIQGFRWAMLGKGQFPGAELAIATAVVLVLLVGGLFYFKRMERNFADVV